METKTHEYEIPDFAHFKAIIPKHKNKTHKHFGIHGMCILVKEKLMDNIKLIEGQHDSIIWIKVSDPLTNSDLIIGAIYVPHENSKYFESNTFDRLQDDLTSIQATYQSLPILMLGDFNSRTSNVIDIIKKDDNADMYELGDDECSEDFIATGKCNVLRSNEDKVINSNGKKLLEFCKGTGLCIVNGRCGLDKGIGKYTFSKENQNSTIDYALIQAKYFDNIKNFYIDQFDPCLSDAHHPLCVDIHFEMSSRRRKSTKSNHTKTKVVWIPGMKEEYSRSFEMDKIKKLASNIHQLENVMPDQHSIDDCVRLLKNIFLKPAKALGMHKVVKYTGDKEYNINKPWFDKDCKLYRKNYYRDKQKLKERKDIQELKARSKLYKKYLRSKTNDYFSNLHQKLRNTKNAMPKDFWKIINGNQKQCTIIEEKAFFEHFKQLSEHGDTEDNTDDILIVDLINEEINKAFTIQEILDMVKAMRNNKACGLDNILNEYVKNSPSEMMSVLEALFNLILNTGIIPSDWTLGIIIPLHKKGPKSDPNNYRGITLLSCIGKLFTALLNKRLNDFMENNNLLGLEQAGFRSGFSTIDHIFTLNSLIELYTQNNKRLYCAFVDYSKAFDLVDRSSLWTKVVQNGINGKVLKIIKNMYENAKSCLKSNNNISDFFQCNIGVRQGENLSPLLFAIYLNDFQSFLSKNCRGTLDIAKDAAQILNEPSVGIYLQLYVLLYADDTILLAESPKDLQNSLDTLYEYCKKWKLTVNMDKTNIVVFSKGKVTKVPQFKYGNTNVTYAHSYTYLGVVMKHNKNFDSAIDKQIAQANRALHNLLVKSSRLKLPIDILLSLYNILVLPVLLYGCEIWGVGNISKVETFQRKFMKKILNVNYLTPTCIIYAELGNMPVEYIIKQRILNYWCRIVTSQTNKLSCIMYKYLLSRHNALDTVSSKWVTYIENSLMELKLKDQWNNPPQSLDMRNSFKRLVKFKCRELFESNIMKQIIADSRCNNYRLFKNSVGFEEYLVILDKSQAQIMAKWRFSDNLLPNNKIKFTACNKDDILCKMCDRGEVGDEAHFLLRCDAFSQERIKYLRGKYPSTSSDSIKEMMTTKSKWELTQLSNFVKEIMEKHIPILKETHEGKFLKRNKISKYGRKIRNNIDVETFLY